jgi:phosphate uptake regulator
VDSLSLFAASALLTINSCSEVSPIGLAQYGEAVEFILGTATGLEPRKKNVTISIAVRERQDEYDILVIATGSRTISEGSPWKVSLFGYEATKDVLHKLQRQVADAKTILMVVPVSAAFNEIGERVNDLSRLIATQDHLESRLLENSASSTRPSKEITLV